MTHIYYVEYDATHPGNFVFNLPGGHDCWLLVLTQTPAEFWVDGEMKEYPPNCAVLYPPHHKILYRACTDKYVNDWVRFDSAESYLTGAAIPLGIPFPLPNPGYCHKLFQLLVAENMLNNNYRELSIDHLFKVLFNKLHEASHYAASSSQHQILSELRRNIYNNPGYSWSVSAMAASLHLSPGYLQALYKQAFGISCINDVINCRIRLARDQLIHSPHTIAEIAALCGYSNVEHFSRQFHKKTGHSPHTFRKLSMQGLLIPSAAASAAAASATAGRTAEATSATAKTAETASAAAPAPASATPASSSSATSSSAEKAGIKHHF